MFSFLFKIGSAIKCFECNSHFNEGCDKDIVPSEYSVDCSLKNDRDDRNKPIQYTFCRKILQVIEFSVNQCKWSLINSIKINKHLLIGFFFIILVPANTRVVRSCGYDARNYANSCYKRHGFGGRQTVCACENSDNCNHSNSLKSPMALIALFSIGVIGFISL